MSLAEIRKMRYDFGEGYFWINDTREPYPTMIMHPIEKKLNGISMGAPEFNCAEGARRNLGQAFLDVCAKSGQGFVRYRWAKPLPPGWFTTCRKCPT